jgi:hypothetical protein
MAWLSFDDNGLFASATLQIAAELGEINIYALVQ